MAVRGSGAFYLPGVYQSEIERNSMTGDRTSLLIRCAAFKQLRPEDPFV